MKLPKRELINIWLSEIEVVDRKKCHYKINII
uniref:Uncharacterized protein n=1 Tax=Rhizophora mucronata TaxID=61149 RepID=A0A2P2IYM4_RHIMU